MNHLLALSEKDEKGGFIVSVQQTRLTHLFIHVLVLITLFAMKILKTIPMSVLYGVFLYMGVAALAGNQFYERILMLFMQPSRCPKRPYTEYVPRRDMIRMTVVQVALFALLYIVKTIKSIAIAFPLVIAACIPMRLYVLPRMISADALIFLDGDDTEISKAVALKKASTLKEGLRFIDASRGLSAAGDCRGDCHVEMNGAVKVGVEGGGGHAVKVTSTNDEPPDLAI